MKKLVVICAIVTMMLAISGVTQAVLIDINGQSVNCTPYGYSGQGLIASGPSITLSGGAGVNMDGTMSNTGVQHFGFDLAISSPPYLSGFRNSWLGLDFGQIVLKRDHFASDSTPFCSILFDAAAGNSAPANSINPADLLMRFNFNGSRSFVGFAPGSYTFDFAFDNINNTTTLNISGDISASKTWNGTFSVNCFDFASRSWSYGEGSTLQISNFVYGQVPEPATMALLGLGGLMLRRKK